jgi:hypothetical protein
MLDFVLVTCRRDLKRCVRAEFASFPSRVVEVIAAHPYYEIRIEEVFDSEAPTIMRNCYSTKDGYYIGDEKIAKFLCDKMGIWPENGAIGYSKKNRRYYGWSHRAICGFGLGDMLFDERCPEATDTTPFTQHGTVEVRTLAQAKQAARNFARYVS